MGYFTRILAGCAIAGVAACGDDRGLSIGPVIEPRTERFSFEDGLGDWSPDAADVTVGGETLEWEITSTDEAARDGKRALRFTLDNRSDAGKIWIERRFELQPQTSYSVFIELALGTADSGDLNLWTVIAGAFPHSPETREDLAGAFQDDAGHDQGPGAGLVWVEKSYDILARTNSDGVLHVALGLWGTYEVARTYYLDAVQISFTRVLPT